MKKTTTKEKIGIIITKNGRVHWKPRKKYYLHHYFWQIFMEKGIFIEQGKETPNYLFHGYVEDVQLNNDNVFDAYEKTKHLFSDTSSIESAKAEIKNSAKRFLEHV